MASDLLRDLLIVNRRFFDDAVATVRAQANHDIDRALRDASLWAYREASRRPKSELQQINGEAQDQAERQIADIQTATAEKIDILKTLLHERERSIRAYCEQPEESKRDSERHVVSAAQYLTRVGAPVPPNLTQTFGYNGHARFVGFFYESIADEVMHDDGRSAGTAEWFAFRQWQEHPAVAIHVEDLNLGCSDLPATHWLIIDRERAVLYAARVSTAQAFLQNQHPRPPQLQPNQIAEIHRRMEMQQHAVAEMIAFLDNVTAATQDSPRKSV